MNISRTIKAGLLATSAGLVLCHASAALAQDAAPQADTAQETNNGGLDTIVVTATKRGQASNVQDVPFAVTAFGAAQLEEQHFQTFQSLSYSMPNVQLSQIGTTPGYANFSIRGLGINSSIPSIDPTVGVFIDGVYLGVSAGVVFGNFDIEGLEVLRGPQGLLFGRNVTGGAVVVRTTVPKDHFAADFKASVSSGPEYKVSGTITGPIVQDKISAKLAVYYDKDEGYFHNDFNGNDHLGKNRTFIVRPALRFTPIDGFESIFRYEYGKYDGDGAVATNHGLYPVKSFRVNLDEEGFAHNYWHMASNETNIDTDFGNGKITNIMAYREYNSNVANDIDASPVHSFHSGNTTHQKQMSDELRYAGTFGRVDVTTGLYFFTQRIAYIEQRTLSGGTRTLSGGGIQNQDTYGAFGAVDWHFTDSLTLNLGARYSSETKSVKVANLTATGCDYEAQTCDFTFHGKNTWKGLTPRVGLQWQPDPETQVYAFWAKGFRSGGYNFRNVNPAVDPGPFDDEVQNSYEIGMKKDIGGILRVNVAGFWNKIDGVQREIQTPVLGSGTAQIITNSANARIRGVEGEVTLRPGAGFTLSGQFGYTEGKYTKIIYDLNNDGVISDVDYGLKLPRLAPWTYGGTLAWSHDFDQFGVDARVSANHRDADWYNDANTGLLRGATMVDANLTLRYGGYSISAYATNLLNEATYGTEAPLPFFAGSTFAPLNKGRVYGIELAAKF
ncbi:TonB-dependent receptor [Novosphingobium lindaniclasticum]